MNKGYWPVAASVTLNVVGIVYDIEDSLVLHWSNGPMFQSIIQHEVLPVGDDVELRAYVDVDSDKYYLDECIKTGGAWG